MKKNYLYSVLKTFVPKIFKLYYNPTIIGKENIPINNKVIIAGNHIHNFDAILVGCSTRRNLYFLAKKELFKGPLKLFFNAVGCIPVDRNKKNKESMDIAIKHLENDDALFIAPEGTRNKTNELLLPFKPGTVVMAERTNAVIVPYSITGEYKFRSKNLKIEFDKPIDVSGLEVEEANELLFKKVKKILVKNKGEVNEKK